MATLLINKRYGSLLDKNWFSYGNIKPDLDSKMKTLDHSIYGTDKHIKIELEKIKNYNLTKEEFSESLGIINHFICDSFCAYHNRDNLIQSNLFKHFLYEKKIHGKLKVKRDFSKYKTFLNKDLPELITNSDLISFLKNYQFEYSKKKIKPARDLRYSIRASIFINTTLLKSRQKEIYYYEKNPNLYLTNRKWA